MMVKARLNSWICLILVAMLGSTCAKAAPFVFGLLPTSGTIEAAPGDTVGWGYTISNPSSNWLVLTDLSAGSFNFGTPDSSFFDFPILEPGQSNTVSFDLDAFTGLFAFTWDPSAPAGSINAGGFRLDGEFWSGDPFAGGVKLANADPATASYLTEIQPSSVVPEPSTVLLLGFGIIIGLVSHPYVSPLRTND